MEIPLGIKKVATMCLLKNGNQFLLLKRIKEPHQSQYTPVGGKIDPFENPTDAIKREVFEETGIKVDKAHFCGVLVETSPVKFNWVSFIYYADIDFIDPPDCNEGKLEWVQFENILKIPTPTTDWFIYKYILEGTKFILNADYDSQLKLIKMTNDIKGELIYDSSMANNLPS